MLVQQSFSSGYWYNTLLRFFDSQDDFLVWEGEPKGKGKERHIFIFEEQLVITKKVKGKKTGELPTFEYKAHIQVWTETDIFE